MTRYSVFVSCFVALIACGGNGNGNGGGGGGGGTDGGGSGSGSGGGGGGGAGPFAIPLTTPDGPVEFYAPMLTVNGAMFAMDLDTGSTTTAIAGSACADCNGSDYTLSPLYMPSSSAVNEGSNGESEYADGTGWFGAIWQDTIGLGNSSPTATLNIVDISTQMVPDDPQAKPGFFSDNGYQGILGMGAPENEIDDTGAYFQSITQSGVDNVMAFELCADSGTMWLGGFDASKGSGAMQYTPMDPITPYVSDQDPGNPFYAVDLTGVTVTNPITGLSGSDLGLYVVDTGTSLFYPTTNVFNAAIATIDAAPALKTLFGSKATLKPKNANDEPCVTATGTVTDDMINSMLPAFTMTLKNAAGGADITISAPALDSYLYDDGGGQFCLAMFDGGDEPTIGDEVMQAFLTVIDLKNMQVGFAPDSGCANPHLPHDRTKHFVKPKPHHPHRVRHS